FRTSARPAPFPIIHARFLLCVARGVEVSRSYCGLSSSSVFQFLGGLFQRISLSISARAGNKSDYRDCIHRLLSRISLLFWLRARVRSVHDHTPYHQQTLGSSFLPWSSPSVSVVSSLILLSRPGRESVNKVWKQIKCKDAFCLIINGLKTLNLME